MGLYWSMGMNSLADATSLFDDSSEETDNEWDSGMSNIEDEAQRRQKEESGEEEDDDEEEVALDWDSCGGIGGNLNTQMALEVFRDTFYSVIDQLCPVRTGYLRSTIGCSISGNTIECWADADYAEYVEYGTYKMRAQPYFEPAIEQALEAYILVQESEIEQAVGNWATRQTIQILDSGQNAMTGNILIDLLILALILLLVSLVSSILKYTIYSAMIEIMYDCIDESFVEIT